MAQVHARFTKARASASDTVPVEIGTTGMLVSIDRSYMLTEFHNVVVLAGWMLRSLLHIRDCVVSLSFDPKYMLYYAGIRDASEGLITRESIRTLEVC